MVDNSKFNRHDSGRHFKKPTFKNGLVLKENSYTFVIKLKLQVSWAFTIMIMIIGLKFLRY